MDKLCGIAMNRLGMTSKEFYYSTPLEFHWALEDYEKTHYEPIKLIADVIRWVGLMIHNNAFGRAKKDVIGDPKRLYRFGWEKPKVQTLQEMKAMVEGLAMQKGVVLSKGGQMLPEIGEET